VTIHPFGEAGHVHGHAAFCGHELRQVHWEAIRSIKLEGDFAGQQDLPGIGESVRVAGEQIDATVEGPAEGFFLAADGVNDIILPLADFRERIAHQLDDGRHQPGEEGPADVQILPTVAGSPAEDAADDIASALVRGYDSVGDGEGQHTGVVGDDSAGDVGWVVLANHVEAVGQAGGLPVPTAAKGFDLLYQRNEQVGGVVALLSLQHGADPLKAHAGVNVPCRQGRQLAVFGAVELDEHEVPDLDHSRVAGIDEGGAGGVVGQVDVNFAAGPAGACLAHLPEVVLSAAAEDV